MQLKWTWEFYYFCVKEAHVAFWIYVLKCMIIYRFVSTNVNSDAMLEQLNMYMLYLYTL